MKSHHFQYFITYYKQFITKTSYWFVFLLLGSLQLVSQETGTPWPKEIESGSYIITLYHPENISYIDLRLDANTAFSVKKGEEGTPTFGMMWTTSLLDVDRNTRIASLVSVKVKEVRFPEEVSEESKNSFKKLIEEEVPKWDVQFSLDDLIESIENVSAYDADLNTSPPKILFSSVPSVLISIDGEPKFKAAEKETEVILNSSAFIAHDTQSGLYYLKGGDFWYEAKAALGPWSSIKKAPSKIRKLAKKAESDTDYEAGDDYQGVAPKIIVTTEPSELIVTEGEPSYAPLQNTSLLYVENSQDDLFMNINQQSYYILLSGRWFTSKSVEGPWNFVEADALPEDFKKINKESKKGHVLPSVAGTKEAKEAIYDNQIPQTAAVDRTTQASKVNYDGEPAFEKIEGLQLEYAVNTQSDVFKDKNTFYLCDNAIWFESSSPNGPWKVSNDRPEEVSQIPPDNPKYNTKYVYIYETTPSVVYVGYTPGYYGSYVYHNTIFYGTGYYYNPWYNGFYYRYPFTYGFSVRYNPWYGWSFGFHFGSPFSWWGYGYWGRWNYWGPPFYRPPYYRPGYRPRPSRPIYHGGRRGVNRYARPVNRPNVRPNRPSTRPTTRPNTRPTTRPNTRPTTPSTRPTTRPTTRPNMPSTRPSTRPSVPTTRPQTRPSRPMTRPAPRPSRPVARPAGGRVRR